MKKIISLLIALAMLMAMAPAVLAAGSGTPFDPFVYETIDDIPAGLDLEPYQEIYIQAPACGATVTLYDVEECTEIGYQHPRTGMFFTLGSTAGAGSATVTLDENNGFFGEAGDPVVFAIANRSPAAVTVGLAITPASNNQGGNQPAGNELALGDNAIVLAAGDADGETYTFTATESGELTIDVTALAMDQGFGMEPVPAQFLGMALQSFAFMVNDASVFDTTISVAVAAGDVVTIQFACPMMRYAAEATFALSMGSGSQGGGQGGGETVNPGDYFVGSGTIDDPYIIVTLDDAVQIMVAGGSDIYYKYLCESTGTVTVSDVVADGILFDLNETGWSGGDSVDVQIDDILMINIWSMNPTVNGSATVAYGEGSGDQGGGNGGGAGEPDGSMSNPYIIQEMPYTVSFYGGMDLYYTYVAPANGTITANKVAGAYLTLSHDYELIGDVYHIAVAEGDEVTLNPWTMESEISGDMVFEFTEEGNNPGGGEGSEPAGPITGTADADEDSKYVYLYTPTENGTLTITVGNGSTWLSDVMDFSSFAVIATAGGTAADSYTCEVVAGVDYAIRIYGEGDPCAAISGIPYTIEFTPDGTGSGGSEPEEFVEMTDEITAEGTFDLTVSDAAITTLYTFEPEATGVYKIELIDGAEMSLWSTIMYNKVTDAENGILTVEITSVGQNYFIGLTNGTAAQIRITRTGDAVIETYPTTKYENKSEPVKFDNSAYEVTGQVNITDNKVDTAVLGEDGYYHLNSADGEILYVNFKAEAMNLIEVWKNGSTGYAQYDNGEVVGVTAYQDAMGEYLLAENKEGILSFGNTYHPLTADLIEMLKNIGQNNGWYGEGGLVGATEDAWMFACVTMTAKASSPATGDFGVIAAAIAMGVSAICGTAVIVKKKEI